MSIKNIQNNYSSSQFSSQDLIKSEQLKDIKEESLCGKESELNIFQHPNQIKTALAKITKGLNEMVKVFNRKIDFVVHEDTQRMMVKVVDTENGKVLREIPPEEILDLVAKMQKAFGIIFDVKV